MKILVTVKNVYGIERIYPACDTAIIFAGIAGTATLGHSVIQAIKALGYTIEVKAQTI